MNPIVGFSFKALSMEFTTITFLPKNFKSFLFVQIIISALLLSRRFVTCLLPIEPYPTTKIFKLISSKTSDK